MGATCGRIGKALTVSVKPDHLATDVERFVKQGGVCGERQVEASLDEIGGKAGGKCWVGDDGRNVGNYVLGHDRFAERDGELSDDIRTDVRCECDRILLERVHSTTTAIVMIKIGLGRKQTLWLVHW